MNSKQRRTLQRLIWQWVENWDTSQAAKKYSRKIAKLGRSKK